MIVRTYRKEDFSQVESIYDASRPDEFYRETEKFIFEPWASFDYGAKLIPDSKIWVCEKEFVVGFCGHKSNHINWLFVDSKFRGKGIALSLLLKAVNELRGEVTITVLQSNVRAVNLYHKAGFQICKEFLADFQGHSLAVYRMSITKN